MSKVKSKVMVRVTFILALIFCNTLWAQNVSPDQYTNVSLSNNNPNHIVCMSGDINDTNYPKHIPIETGIGSVGRDLFLAYKFKRNIQGGLEFVTTKHVIHITCNGDVYSLNITPIQNVTETLYLGDNKLAAIKANAKLIKHKDVEDIMVELTLAAINNDLPPQYSVKREGSVLPAIFDGLKIIQRRTIQLNGMGLRLKEYEVFSNVERVISKRQFIRREFSQALRMITIVNQAPSPEQPARLFIVEDK
ncbi:MAG: type-F conjugative transfer system secretin TraK [Alteromonadaceae bacterium]|nr:type-F conjugative transfer system secretin TraK [Alteromonadaceae bacterium]